MKRLASILLAVCLLIPAAFAEERLYSPLETEIREESLFQYVVGGGVIWTVRAGEARRYSADTFEPLGDPVWPNQNIEHIAADETGLYGSEGGRAVLFDGAGEIAKEWALPSGVQIDQFFVTDRYIVALEATDSSQYSMNGTRAWKIDRESGEAQTPDCAVGIVAAVNAPEGNMLLLCCGAYSAEYEFLLWDLSEDTTAKLGVIRSQANTILSDGTEGAFYLDSYGVRRIDFATGRETEVASLMTLEYGNLAGLDGDPNRMFVESYDMFEGGARLIALDPTQAADERTMLRMNNLGLYQTSEMLEAIRLFETARPDVRVVFDERPQEQLTAALLAQDGDLDILPVTSYTMDSYIQNGVLVDLSANAKIASNLEKWRDADRLLRRDGKLYALPLFISVDALYPEAALFPDVGLNIDTFDTADMTWPEFYDLCRQTYIDTGIFLYSESSRFPAPVKQYVASFETPDEIRFQTDEFYAIVSALKQIYSEGVIEFGKFGFGGSSVIKQSAAMCGAAVYAFEPWIYLPPRIGEADAYSCLIDCMGVNARSERADIALEFMGVFSSEEAQRKDTKGAMLADASAYDDAPQSYSLMITDASVALWERALGSAGDIGLISGTFGLALGDEMEKYLNGESTEKELAQALEEKLFMVLMG